MKNTGHYIPLAVLILSGMLGACAGGDGSRRATEAAEETGRRDAREAMSAPANSMEREKGVFAIRARETGLREAGLDSCANAYARGAYEIIDSVLRTEEDALR